MLSLMCAPLMEGVSVLSVVRAAFFFRSNTISFFFFTPPTN
jgi:hypothetical protein